MIQLQFYLDNNCDLHLHVGYCIEYQSRIAVNSISSLGYLNIHTLYKLIDKHIPIVAPMLVKMGNFKETGTLLDSGNMYIHYTKLGELYVCKVYAYLNHNLIHGGIDNKVMLYEELIPAGVLKFPL